MSDIRPIIPEGAGLLCGAVTALVAWVCILVIVVLACLLHFPLRRSGRRGCFSIGAWGGAIDLNRRSFQKRR